MVLSFNSPPTTKLLPQSATSLDGLVSRWIKRYGGLLSRNLGSELTRARKVV